MPLGWRKSGHPDVREAALEQYLKVDHADAHFAVPIQNLALHLEMTNSVLIDELTNRFQPPLVYLLRELPRGHGLLQFGQIPICFRVEFRGFERKMNIEVNPFLFRFSSGTTARRVHL